LSATQLLIILTAILAIINIILLVVITRQGKALTAPRKEDKPAPPTLEITSQYLAELESRTKTAFEQTVEENVNSLNRALKETVEKINRETSQSAQTVIRQQVAEYQTALAESKESIIKSLTDQATQTQNRQQQLDAKLEEQMQQRRVEVVAKLEKNLSEIVIGYIAQSLGSGVDFNAQKDYVFQALDDHKEDMKKDILG